MRKIDEWLSENPEIINVTTRYQIVIRFGLVIYTLSSLVYLLMLVFMWLVDFLGEARQ